MKSRDKSNQIKRSNVNLCRATPMSSIITITTTAIKSAVKESVIKLGNNKVTLMPIKSKPNAQKTVKNDEKEDKHHLRRTPQGINAEKDIGLCFIACIWSNKSL